MIRINNLQAIGLMEVLGEGTQDGLTLIDQQGDSSLLVTVGATLLGRDGTTYEITTAGTVIE